MKVKEEAKKTVTISAPKIKTATFEIVGIAPLVIHRFSAKTKNEMKLKMETGKAASSKKNRGRKIQMIYTKSRAIYLKKDGMAFMLEQLGRL